MNRGQGKDEAVSLAVQCALPLDGGYSFEVKGLGSRAPWGTTERKGGDAGFSTVLHI